ncbi:7,8-dihydroneopterin aldolase [Sulfuriferula plumbiphila]|uniref:Dihydroneopterin aldolase n=1 Tax=Sulfuriferula plumbiphila TaxID=171865 RepID=A0A512L4W7_9PROT|nr:dihydroneopterin aldolase [Sulfuriferula plumbiphila]BBP03236.1 7,8-dihydroneopterin aldolase [Sulfuriferula plumbiphila]GEP29523.1 7,8-dihydroneopterin aldolase [Sulfuriferula plumbiphila]
MDILFLKDFRVELIIGIYEWERKVPQPVLLDLEIGLPNSRAGETDNVADTIDYGQVAARIRAACAALRPALVEALAEHVAQLIRNEFGAPWVRVTVTKLAIVRGVKALGITIERGQRGCVMSHMQPAR